MESIDERLVAELSARAPSSAASLGGAPEVDEQTATLLLDLFSAQAQSRHLDLAARTLQARGAGFYTIASSGHESNAALGLLAAVTDPALLHYRSGGFYAARAARAGHRHAVTDVLQGVVAAKDDPISGGRHKVFGHPRLHVLPQTSTIASHLPRAVGLGFALGLASRTGARTPWPEDAVVLCSFGDASVNHSTAAGGLNAAAYLAHRKARCPVLFVCEDNGLGISTRSPAGWVAATLRGVPGIPYLDVDGDDPVRLLAVTAEALRQVRTSRRPVLLHLRTVRFGGHAGSDAETAYRTPAEISADEERDPLLATARVLLASGTADRAALLNRYETARREVAAAAQQLLDPVRLQTAEEVTAPLRLPTSLSPLPVPMSRDRQTLWRNRLPEDGADQTLAQAVNATLTDLMLTHPETLVLGQDVGAKGGVYGVTRGLLERFGPTRVFDTLLDEQTVLGTALGAASAGYLPIAEIQYLAFLHNAEDQLRGEAASLRFFSDGQFHNGMVVRVPGLAYQRGFGGHFHNDNSLAVLRDIPGLVLAVPSHPADASRMLRTCFALAALDGRVCVVVEPIARYHTRDLHTDGDGQWTARYPPPVTPWPATVPLGQPARHGEGRDALVVTFGNGTYLARRAAARLTAEGIAVTVLDLRWLAPLPAAALLEAARGFDRVLVADETRRSGGVSEAVVTALVDGGYAGRLARVASVDSFVPLGPAADAVLLSERDIVLGVRRLLGRE